jgi:hypothetical protein
VFMVTSLTLAYFSGHKAVKSIISSNPAPVQQSTSPASE